VIRARGAARSGLAADAAQDGDAVERLLQQGDLDAAIEAQRGGAARDPAEAKLLAWLEQRRGDYEASVRTLDSLLREHPNDGEARLGRARGLWQAGDLAGAEASLARIVADGGDGDAVTEQARSELASLRAHLEELAPVAAAARRLEAAFWIGIVLLGILVLASLRRVTRPLTGSSRGDVRPSPTRE